MLTKTGMHAIRAVLALGRLPEGEFAGAARVAREIGAPENYLGKLLKNLAEEGVVVSQKGLGGGFRLARDPRTISLFDVVNPTEHLERWAECLLGRSECSDRHACAIHFRWKAVRESYLQLLRRTNVAELLAKGELQELQL